jgi:uncharacterized repeat protein (TIGR02543 family)
VLRLQAPKVLAYGLIATLLAFLLVANPPANLPPASATSPDAGECSDASGTMTCNLLGEVLTFANLNVPLDTLNETVTVADVFRFDGNGDGDYADETDVRVDAIMTVTARTGGSISRSGTNLSASISTNNNISVRIDFVSGGRAVVLENLEVATTDLDGPRDSAGQKERVNYSGIKSFALSTLTQLQVDPASAPDPETGSRTFIGTQEGTAGDKSKVVVTFQPVSSIGLNPFTGSGGTGGGIGFVFGPPTWDSDSFTPTNLGDARYTITYDGNSSDDDDLTPDDQTGSGTLTVSNGGDLEKTIAPGTTVPISSWNTVRNGVGGIKIPLGGSYRPIANVTLYAQYETSTVTFEINDDSGTPATSQQGGGLIPLRANTFTRDGFTFAGWNTNAAGDGLAIADGGTFSFDSDDILYAQWTPNPTLTYNANASQHQSGVVTGSAPSSQTESAGTTVTLSANTGTLARQGFTFDGWNTADDGSGTDYDPGDTYTLNSNVTLYAQWGIPQAARLFGQEDDDGNRTEDVIDVTGGSASFTGNVRGITTDGSFIYYLPRSASGSNTVWKVNFDGAVAAEKTVSGDSTALGVMRSASSDTAQRDLAYSSGCIFLRGGSLPSYSTMYCIDTTSNDWSINEVAVPSPGIPTGQGWGYGSILDFPDGKLAVVGANSTTLGAEPSGYDGESDCPNDHYCKILRVFEVSGSGSSVTLSHDQDILLADTESNWPSDNHGIASDGTYLFQSHHEFGYKTWGLQSGVSYIVFNGDGNADVDGTGGTYRASTGHNDNCGATTGVSGGFCPINPEVNVDARNRPVITRQMINTTYLTRDHTNQRYIMGDYGAPRFLLTEAATDQPDSDFTQPAPTAPSSVSGTSANQAVTVSWGASTVSGGGAISYTVTSTPGSFTCRSSATSCQVTGLTNGTTYTFSVVASVGSVNSTVAVSAGVTPSATGSSGGGTTTPVVTPVVTPPSPAIPRILTPPQPTPRPTILQGPVTSPGRGFDPSIGTRATIGGAPATVAKRALPTGGVSVQTGALQFGLTLKDPQGGGGVDTNTPSNSPEIRVPSGQSTIFTGSGLLPGSQLQVWLPGRTGEQAKELARVPVKEDGSFDTELSFTARQTETPVAIGRQVMQVAGFDENGNQTVVDMTINVSQGPITPEPNREQGALPDLSIGSSLATSAGIPTPVTVIPLPDERRVSIGDGSWTLQVDVDSESGAVERTSEAPVIRMVQGTLSSASGDGFMPGTTASVWMFSDPTLMGTVTVAEDGSFTTEFLVDPLFLPAGEHTLQVQGVGEDGFIKAANLGVSIEEPVALTGDASLGLLWWGLGFLVALLAILFVFFLLRRKRA